MAVSFFLADARASRQNYIVQKCIATYGFALNFTTRRDLIAVLSATNEVAILDLSQTTLSLIIYRLKTRY